MAMRVSLYRYFWPEERTNADGSLMESGSRVVGAGDTLYMSDQLGLHKVSLKIRHRDLEKERTEPCRFPYGVMHYGGGGQSPKLQFLVRP
jgi:hypothetical protein